MEYDLVFEGGGAKGMVFVGAMKVFESLGHTSKRLLGTSAGAITACLLAAGYDSREMLEALGEKEGEHSVFAGFMSIPPALAPNAVRNSTVRNLLRRVNVPFLPDTFEEKLDDNIAGWLANQNSLRCVFSFVEDGGWYSADNFVAWLQRRLDCGSFRGQPRQFSKLTLAQFFQATGTELSVVASDTSGQNMLVLNHVTAPDLPLVWAVRMSMSIPLLWQSVVWKPEWGQYRGRDMTGHEIVDGGLLSNFPIELFISGDKTVRALMGPDASDNVLGLLIDEALAVPGAEVKAAASPEAFRITDLPAVQRLNNLVNTATTAHDKMVIDSFEPLVARMPARGYGTTEFDMTEERRALLVQAGADAMQAYFDNLAASAGNVSFDPLEAARAEEKADRVALKILGQ